MTAERIKEIQEQTAYPESVSVQQALLQVWNECEQEHQEKMKEKSFGFYDWHKSMGFVSLKRDDFQEYLDSDFQDAFKSLLKEKKHPIKNRFGGEKDNY